MKNDQNQYQTGVDVKGHVHSSQSGTTVPVRNEFCGSAAEKTCGRISPLKERGLPLTGTMVRATLRNLNPKTQTRRLFKLPRGMVWYDEMGGEAKGWSCDARGPGWWHVEELRSPYGDPGDRLWVREAWRTEARFDHLPPAELPLGVKLYYEADGGERPEWAGRYRHGRFMPRWASRILLEVVCAHVERLQDISEADAKADGIEGRELLINGISEGMRWRDYSTNSDDVCEWFSSPVDSYRVLWESLHGTGSWAANPWVWVVKFKRV